MKERLVLLPGWAMHSGVWGEFATQLSTHFTLTLIDHLPSLGNIDAVADGIVELLDDEPFYLLGWSLGGNVALNIAWRYPERVQGLILLATNPCCVANEAWPKISCTVRKSAPPSSKCVAALCRKACGPIRSMPSMAESAS